MLMPQQITAACEKLKEEEAKAMLVEIFTARNYGNQEMIQTVNEIVERLGMEKQ